MLSLGLAFALTVGGVSVPDRLTAGPADQFLGALSADEKQLYFISNEQSTTQVLVEDVARGIPRLLFDEIADVSWPRPSPDGKHLLYISYQTDAAGDVCVRDLDAKGVAGERHCLTDATSAEVQAIWMPGGQSLAVVTRTGLHGDFELVQLSLSGHREKVLVKGNLSSPAISSDGKWLAYVPVERPSADIGPSFLAHAGGALAFQRVDGTGDVLRAVLDLPGTSGFPTFSLDGKWVYFTQFLNDTNLDGAIDGNDNGVLFRAPFSDGKLGPPEQLTSARMSCQYPSATAHKLLATCQQQGSLDVFQLPLEGGVPPAWTPAQIDDELSASTDRWEQLLLLARRGGGPDVLRQMIRLQLELGEYESATFYAKRLARTDAATGNVLVELAAARTALRALGRGELSATFVADARARLTRLEATKTPLAAVVESEIHDTLGEEQEARALLDGPGLRDTTDALLAALYAERLLEIYRDEPRFFELYQPLAERFLEHAQGFVRELVRGCDAAGRAKITDAWAKKVDPDSDLAFLLALERALADLTPATQDAVRARVFDLYKQNKELTRRKALVDETVRRAVTVDNEYLLYQFADTWVSYVPHDKAERRHAEALYRDAVLERAYVSEAKGAIGDARGNFYGVTLQTESLESHAGFIEMRILEGKDPAADYKGKPESVVTRYARAYQVARQLPSLADPLEHEAMAQSALADLELITSEAPQRAEVHQLWGYVAQQRWLRTGDRLSAVEANAHELLALDLARDRPRLRAAILESLGALQDSVGNYAIGLGWLEARDKLPFATPLARAAHCLELSRARFHAGDMTLAATGSDDCLAQIGADKTLARFTPLALDRSALYHLAAGDAKLAAARYASLWPLVKDGTGAEAARNRLTTQAGWASAALQGGDFAVALDHVTQADALLASGGPPIALDGAYGRGRTVSGAVITDWALILAGLRAQASYDAGQLPEAATALTKRRDGLAARLAKTDLDEDRLELAACEGQLALYAYRQHALPDARAHLEAGLKLWDTWSANTGTPIEDTGLALLAAYAELHLVGGVPLAALKLDLPGRLAATFVALSAVRNPDWEPMRQRFEVYLSAVKVAVPDLVIPQPPRPDADHIEPTSRSST